MMKKRWHQYESIYHYLAAVMRRDGMHYAERLQPEKLKALDEQGRGVILRSTDYGTCRVREGYPTGCAFVWPTLDRRTFEIGSVWVHKSHRGNGFAKDLLKEAASRIPIGDAAFLITSSATIIEGAMRIGFHPFVFVEKRGLDEWARSFGVSVDREPPEGALLSYVSQAVRKKGPLLRTLLVRS